MWKESMDERVVITGMGTVSPLGLSVNESWENAVNGISGVGPITLFDSSSLEVHIACEVKGFVPKDFMHPKEARRRDRFEQLATAAAKEAIHQAGLEVDKDDSDHVGVIISSAIGGIKTTQDGVIIMCNKGPRRRSGYYSQLTVPTIRMQLPRSWPRCLFRQRPRSRSST